MDASDSDIIASLLKQSSAAALRVGRSRRISIVYNPELLANWLDEPSAPALSAEFDLVHALQQFFPHLVAATLLEQLDTLTANAGSAVHELGTFPVRFSQHGVSPRHLLLTAQHLATGSEGEFLLLIRDASAPRDLQLAVVRAKSAADTSLALLRAAPGAARLFLDTAMASVSALRATLRMPARTSEALRDKLTRLQTSTRQLGQESAELQLNMVTEACETLAVALEQLQSHAALSGNDLLQIAPLLDQIAHAVGIAWRCEEQRHGDPLPTGDVRAAPARTRSRKHANWPQASERRWNQFLRRRGEEIGILARLTIVGAEAVPTSIRRDIDEILQHLLRNALEHGIETPEQRLAADKPAAGQISVQFEDKGTAGLRIAIRDDGRGFDLQRIGKAAVKCGLISEESLLDHEAGDVVGFIFKPGFTTESLGDSDGHGRGMIFLRNAVTRLNGQVSVATKTGRYTQFNLQLPVGASLHAAHTPAYA